MEMIDGYDIVVDGTDNFSTRYLINDVCVLKGKPYVFGSVLRFEGQASVFAIENHPCYRCLYPKPPPSDIAPDPAESGVLGVLPGVIGSIQVVETIKLIIGKGDNLAGRLLLFDALTLRFRELKVVQNPDCPVCGPGRKIQESID
jgi:adenylyltransferase/sulfurtransferase